MVITRHKGLPLGEVVKTDQIVCARLERVTIFIPRGISKKAQAEK